MNKYTLIKIAESVNMGKHKTIVVEVRGLRLKIPGLQDDCKHALNELRNQFGSILDDKPMVVTAFEGSYTEPLPPLTQCAQDLERILNTILNGFGTNDTAVEFGEIVSRIKQL